MPQIYHPPTKFYACVAPPKFREPICARNIPFPPHNTAHSASTSSIGVDNHGGEITTIIYRELFGLFELKSLEVKTRLIKMSTEVWSATKAPNMFFVLLCVKKEQFMIRTSTAVSQFESVLIPYRAVLCSILVSLSPSTQVFRIGTP